MSSSNHLLVALYTNLILTSIDRHFGVGLSCCETDLDFLYLYLLDKLPKITFVEFALASDVVV
jgi:hypothetical protein